MRCLYNIVFILALPLIFGRLLWKARKAPEYKQRWYERLGYFKTRPLENSIWIHAVSLGEAIAAIPLIKALQQQYADRAIVVTTMTPTGSERITKTFGNTITHTYIPYDYAGAIKRFLNHMNPKLLIIMETELWPNLLHYCAKNKVKVLIANARLSQRSEAGYKKVKWFMRKILNNINIIATQSQIDAERFINIGAKPDRVKVVGNIKFDINVPQDLSNNAKQLRQKWGQNRSIWIAASTHTGEDEQVLTAFKKIKQSLPNTLLILVPRHPERFQSVTELCKSSGFNVVSHEKQQLCAANTDIVIGDTIGELLLLYAAADVAFVGGTLIQTVGGHNLLEPAAVGVPVISGPNLFNFIDISNLLTAAHALIKVNDVDELSQQVIKLFQNKDLRQQQIVAGLRVVEQNKGTLPKLMSLIKNYIF